jgi:hypothetical protein
LPIAPIISIIIVFKVSEGTLENSLLSSLGQNVLKWYNKTEIYISKWKKEEKYFHLIKEDFTSE